MNAILTEQVCRNVDVQIEFLRLDEIDNLNEKFSAVIRIIAKWVETQSIDMTQYDPSVNWNPLLYVQNLLSDEPKVNIQYDITRIDDVVRITETKIIKGKFWERFELYDVKA